MLQAFVLPARRDRLMTLFGSAKRRKDATDVLNHFKGWDPRWVCALHSSGDVVGRLRAARAPAVCHVISGDRALDGRDMPLADAVGEAEAYSFASVLCCPPGELAFFFDELYVPRNRWLLRRPAAT